MPSTVRTSGAEPGDQVDPAVAVGRNVLDRRIVASQIGGGDLVDVRVVEHPAQGRTQPRDVLFVRRDEQIEILGGAHDAVKVEGDSAHDLVAHRFFGEPAQQIEHTAPVHLRKDSAVDRINAADRL
jgi:hypothetical protein